MQEDQNQEEPLESNDETFEAEASTSGDTITRVTGMYKDWFLDYASYCLLYTSPSPRDA